MCELICQWLNQSDIDWIKVSMTESNCQWSNQSVNVWINLSMIVSICQWWNEVVRDWSCHLDFNLNLGNPFDFRSSMKHIIRRKYLNRRHFRIRAVSDLTFLVCSRNTLSTSSSACISRSWKNKINSLSRNPSDYCHSLPLEHKLSDALYEAV